jgi:hypothetical protein
MFNNLTDFTGDCNISQTKYGKTDLEAIITTTEETILKELLGEDLYLKVIAAPATYTNLINGYTYSVINGDSITVNVAYKGIKQMLKYFTYAEMLKFLDNQTSQVGQIEPEENNSKRMAKTNHSKLVMDAYNKGVNLYGFDIETWNGNGNWFITGRRNKYKEALSEEDYYEMYVKGSCFNFLYNYKDTTAYLTWQFSEKELMMLNGFL